MTQLRQDPRLRRGREKPTLVGASDMKVSRSRDEVLVTSTLGSCVGLALYDPVAGVGGLIHCLLPLSRIDPELASQKPCMFVDTGVSALLGELLAQGAQRLNLIAKVAGAGSPVGREETFRLGQRNYTILRKFLWKNNILIEREHVGGAQPRTLMLYLADGRTIVNSEGKEVEL